MFYHHHRIPNVPEAFEHGYQPLGIPGMQADGRFVQDVHGPHEGTAQGGHQVHPLALAAGKGVHGSGQREITQAHILDALKAVLDFFQCLARYGPLIPGEFGRFQPLQQFLHGH